MYTNDKNYKSLLNQKQLSTNKIVKTKKTKTAQEGKISTASEMMTKMKTKSEIYLFEEASSNDL